MFKVGDSVARKRKKLLTSKEAARLLKVSSELISYLRINEGLPFTKRNKYIMFSEPDILRWRNRRLAENSSVVLNLQEYYQKTKLCRFISYEDFKVRVEELIFLEGDNVLKYIKRQNVEKIIVDIVGDIVYNYWEAAIPRCIVCGNKIHGHLVTDLCSTCKEHKKEQSNQEGIS